MSKAYTSRPHRAPDPGFARVLPRLRQQCVADKESFATVNLYYFDWHFRQVYETSSKGPVVRA